MSMIVNTNVSSLTAQRSLAESAKLMDSAMERLSTGSKINSASDDAAGLAIVQRMTSQIQGLNMAVKNANDGIAMTQSVEGALVEVTDMLQRMRELAIQASNNTNTDSDRSFIQEEVNLLIAEMTRISSNTRYNGQTVLDGSFLNKQLQVGTEGGEIIEMSVSSVSADQLGAYVVTGDRIEAQLGDGAGSFANISDATDDFIISGNNISSTIDVVAKDSAKNVAAKVNAVSGATGVTAEARTYGLLSSEYATDQSYNLLINNTHTGTFVISRSNVEDAVAKINAISGTTGVTATSTDDNKVRLFNREGGDILVENQSTNTALRVQTLGFDGESKIPSMVWHRATADEASGASGQLGALNASTFTLVQKNTAQTWTFQVSAATTGEPTAQEIQDAINGIAGVSGFKAAAISGNTTDFQVTATEAFGAFDIYKGTDITDAAERQTFEGVGRHIEIADATWAAGSQNLTLTNSSTGDSYAFSVTLVNDGDGTDGADNATALQNAINAISGVSGFTAYEDVGTAGNVHLHGPADFGDWTLSGLTNIDGTEKNAGDLNYFDKALSAGGTSNADAATVQGAIELTSSKLFSVSQTAEESGVVTDPKVATGSLANDNYFTTQGATLDTVSNVDFRTAKGAGVAIKVIDGAIEKVSSMRSNLGAIENRLNHTVSNLMNVAENTASARSRINDADYSVESANLAKAQVLQQAGAAMLSQANAKSQLVLQLLQ